MTSSFCILSSSFQTLLMLLWLFLSKKDLLRKDTEADKQIFFIYFLRKFRRGNKKRLLKIKCTCPLLEMSKFNEDFQRTTQTGRSKSNVLTLLEKQRLPGLKVQSGDPREMEKPERRHGDQGKLNPKSNVSQSHPRFSWPRQSPSVQSQRTVSA